MRAFARAASARSTLRRHRVLRAATPLRNPRPANWTRSDIYPDRLFQGRLLQSVNHVFQWGDDGLDYEIVVPSRAEGVQQMVVKEPVGPVAAFTPWNYPLASPTRKVAGALAAGCSIILKGAEETPAGAMMNPAMRSPSSASICWHSSA